MSFRYHGNYRLVLTILMVLVGFETARAQDSSVALPTVSKAEVPRYPDLAQVANIWGTVPVKVVTDGHQVVSSHAEDGHLLLREAAEKNVQTWQFAPHSPTSFTVTFHFNFVEDLETNNSRVVLKLPTEVEIDHLRFHTYLAPSHVE